MTIIYEKSFDVKPIVLIARFVSHCREANVNGATNGVTLPSPASSLAECDLMAPEADQSKPLSLKEEISQSEAINRKKIGQQEQESDVEVNTKGKGNIFKKRDDHSKKSEKVSLPLSAGSG